VVSSSTGVPLPPPYRGQNDQYPVFSIQSPFCEQLENFNNKGGTLNLRKGNDRFSIITNANIGPLWIDTYNDNSPALFMLVDWPGELRWYDVTTAVPALVHTVATGSGDDEIATLFFNNYLFWFGEGELNPTNNGPVYYNGTAWGNAGYVWPGAMVPMGGCVHKNRAYFIDRQSARYGFTEIDAISGNVTQVDLSSVINARAYLYVVASFSMSENVTQENVLAFAFSNGHVLVYGGSYPNGSDWGLIAQFGISKPLKINSVIYAKGDAFIITRTEILSLRNLLAGGYSRERQEGFGATIRNRLSQIITALIANSAQNINWIKGIYDEKNDRLVISFPYYVDRDGGVDSPSSSHTLFQLIYDFTLGSWYEYWQDSNGVSSVNVSACYHDSEVCVLNRESGKGVVVKADSLTTHLDDDPDGTGTLEINYKLKSAPIPLNKFGVMKVEGVEVIAEAGASTSLQLSLIRDLGAEQTPIQQVVVSTTTEKLFFDVGIEGNVVQYEVSGAMDTSLSIMAINAWVTASQGVGR